MLHFSTSLICRLLAGYRKVVCDCIILSRVAGYIRIENSHRKLSFNSKLEMWFKLLIVGLAASLASAALGPRKFVKPEVLGEIVDDFEGISALTDPFDGRDYRLPNNTFPVHYDITLITNIHVGDFEFAGRVDILIQAVENTNNITLHYRELTFLTVNLLNANGVSIQSPVPFTLQEDVEFLVIQPTAQLTAGTRYIVQILYVGILRNDDAGFYRSSYVDSFGRTVWLATTQFESTDARHAFPW